MEYILTEIHNSLWHTKYKDNTRQKHKNKNINRQMQYKKNKQFTDKSGLLSYRLYEDRFYPSSLPPRWRCKRQGRQFHPAKKKENIQMLFKLTFRFLPFTLLIYFIYFGTYISMFSNFYIMIIIMNNAQSRLQKHIVRLKWYIYVFITKNRSE